MQFNIDFEPWMVGEMNNRDDNRPTWSKLEALLLTTAIEKADPRFQDAAMILATMRLTINPKSHEWK